MEKNISMEYMQFAPVIVEQLIKKSTCERLIDSTLSIYIEDVLFSPGNAII